MKRFVLVVVLLSVALVAAVYLLRVEEVRVTGARSLSPRTIVRASGIEPGDRILWERLTAAERRIERLPAVADAVAERSLPGTVRLRVRERVPIARLDGAPGFVVDAEGVVFEPGDDSVKAVLYGWKGKARPGSTVDRSSRLVLAEYPTFPDVLTEWGRRLEVGSTFTLWLLGGPEIRFGVLRDLEAKARVAAAIIAAERGNKLQYIDVRSPRVPVSRGQTPAPGATPTPQATTTP